MTQEQQIDIFKRGFPQLDIVEAASVGNGIDRPTDKELNEYIEYNDEAMVDGRCKFVPASGAASRMFKDVYALKPETIEKLAQNIEKFAFYDKAVFGTEPYDEVQTAKRLVGPEGLDYGQKPKGVLLFHRYENEVRTALAEHLIEGKEYMRNADGSVNLCFTVSKEHLSLFKRALASVQKEYEERYDVHYNVTFTFQDPDTNTIAVTPDNKPFLRDDGTVLTRPAGHGALIYNLNSLPEELISIKNIDNVAKEKLLPLTAKYKKALMGKALMLRDQVFGYITEFEQLTAALTASPLVNYIPGYNSIPADPYATDECQSLCNEIEEFLHTEFCITMPEHKNCKERALALFEKLNRPIRVCGMVRNEGEPGGGPFIIRDKKGCTSLQILESVQISDPALMAGATHFNPVDLVCCIHDYKGEKFDLTRYVDPQTGFISNKSYQGRELKALELPGLWNGAMSDWLTAFMEVPVETFNPVKVILDLLKDAHQ